MMRSSDKAGSAHTISRVDVTCIRHYARNPRRQRNPEYDRIKASIRAEGLDQLLILSQEPGALDYVLHSGGNTRLQILQELFEETGDERFHCVDCIIRPWSQESNVLFAHLRENELRGGLPFIDKALAVFEAKSLLEKELSVDSLSQRQLEELFRERGFGLSHSMISKMGYAVDTLWPLMPKALAAGLGRPQVEKIRVLERAAREIWIGRRLGDDAAFDAVFAELCRRHDGPEWDIQSLRDALENEITVEAEQNRQVIRLEIEAQLAGRPFDPVVSHQHDLDDEETADTHNSPIPPSPKSADKAIPDHLTAEKTAQLASRADQKNKANDLEHSQDDSTSPVSSKQTVNRKDLAALRAQLWGCAAALAECHGLGETIICLPHQGLGFLLVDVPPQELTETLDPEMLGLVSALWWQLAASSELTVASVDILLGYLDEASTLYQALASHDAGLLFSSVWTPDPGHMSSQLWQHLSPLDWQHLLQMMECYRSIKRLAYDTGIELWVADEGDGDVVQ